MGISDYHEPNLWNSCLCCRDMFECVNLMLNKLLMMKLQVHDVWKWVVCKLCSIGELCMVVDELWYVSWSIDVVVVKWCYGC